MNICIFNRNYWVRRFEEQREVRGYLTSGRLDFVASLHVHPGTDQVNMQDEGERRVMRLDGHGTDVLVTAEQSANHKGDLLLYNGEWFECISAMLYDHTLLSHWNYSFVRVPVDAADSIDVTDPPTEDPAGKKPGEGLFVPDTDLDVETELGLVRIRAGSGLVVDREGWLSVERATADEIRRLIAERRGESVEGD